MGSDAETHSQKSDEEKAQIGDHHRVPSLRTRERKNCRHQRGQRHPENQLSRDNLGLQRVMQQLQSLHWSAPRPLHVYCGFYLLFLWDSYQLERGCL